MKLLIASDIHGSAFWCRRLCDLIETERPDRLILLPGGKAAFAELKAPGKTLRPLQAVRKRQLEALGFRVYVIDSIEQIGGVLDELSAP